MKAIIQGDRMTVMIDGHMIETKYSEELVNAIICDDKEKAIALCCSQLEGNERKADQYRYVMERILSSKVLQQREDIIFFKDISELSVPLTLAYRTLQAEDQDDRKKIETYMNFWTLMSLNPDEQCRKNLFRFLETSGMTLCHNGMFIAYRNVDYIGPDLYTDNYSRTFRIRIGEIVSMPRGQCSSDHTVACDKGLHLGDKNFIKEGYCGQTGLVCLCNPADVVSVPIEPYVGKLRTCAYLPIGITKYDGQGNIIPYEAEDGFDCEFTPQIIYTGLFNTDDTNPYRIIIPNTGLNPDVITDRLLELAKESIKQRTICH